MPHVLVNVGQTQLLSDSLTFFTLYFNSSYVVCSAGKCRIVGKHHNLRKMSHRRREILQSAEYVVNPTTVICRIVDGKCRKKIAAGICRNIDGKCRNYY